MSNLPDGAFLTTINGKRCTAVPKNPRSAAPEVTTSAPARTTTRAPQPTQTDNNQQEDQQPQPQPQPQSESEPQPEPEPTSAPPSSTPDNDVVSSESNSVEDPSTSEVDPPNRAILPTSSTSTSIPSVETQPPEEDSVGGGQPFQEEEAASSTSSELGAPSGVENARPSGVNQGPVSLGLPLLAEADGDSSSSTFLSTATLLAGVSLASPSVSSFFSSSPPSPTGTTESAFPSSFTAILRPSISLSDEDSDSGLLLTDTTPLPGQVLTRVDGKITTIGLAASTARDREGASETKTADTEDGAIQSDRNNDNDSGPNPALIGGVVGGVVGLAIIAFLVWFCLRRRRKSKRSRFSARFSTRMTMPPGAEKRRTYEFDSGSVGPTPRRQRFVATLGYHANKFGWGFMMRNHSTNTVNMNRGNSQFMKGLPSHSRGNSTASFDSRANLSRKDRFFDWWSRLKEDVNFNWRLRNGQGDSWAVRNMMEKDTADMEPDFLGLLAKDEKRRSMSHSMHSRGHSVSSIDRFLGDLGMDLDNSRGPNPFSDSNVASAPKPMDPFADTNAVQPTQKPPNTYVADVRRSRGASLGGGVRASNMSSVYRDSVRSNDSFETRRNKCRSDPFDLEIDHRRLPSLENIQAMPAVDSMYGLPPRPSSFRQGGHASYNSSRYTKASSLGDWSDPGPDVGPSNSTVATTDGWRSKPQDVAEPRTENKRNSGSSQGSGSVGKAL